MVTTRPIRGDEAPGGTFTGENSGASMFMVTEAWKAAYPGAAVGVLAMRHVANPHRHPALDRWIAEREEDLRARFRSIERAALRLTPPLSVYAAYYKRFRKTYHVQLQLESVALKGKPLARAPALVAGMLASELTSLLLTAGHDLEAIHPPVTLTVASGQERYRLLSGQERACQAGDMLMTDAEGVISSILYGPDERTRLKPDTTRVLFVVYAPPGLGRDAVVQHLEVLRAAVTLVAPQAETDRLEIFPAG